MDHKRLNPSTRTYVRRVARSIAKGDEHLADDLEQTTLLVALQRSPRDDSAERPWLFAICANTLRGMLLRDRFVLTANEVELPTVETEPLSSAVDVELRESMQVALDALPALQAEAVSLRYLDGLPPRGVAERLGVPVETARSRIKRGLAQLRRDLQRAGVIERRTNVRWPLALGLPKLFKRSRVAVVAGVAAVVGAVVVADRLTVERSAGGTDRPSVVTGLGVPLAPVVDDARHRTAPRLLTDLGLSADSELLERHPSGFCVELDRDGGELESVRVGETGAAVVPDLEPGDYVARIDGFEVGRRTLEAGSQTWELTWGRGAEVDLLVLDATRRPVPDAEIYERNKALAAPRLIGLTDADGRARVSVTSGDSYVAARSVPGVSSDSLWVGSPSSTRRRTVVLETVERPFELVTVETRGHAYYAASRPAIEISTRRADREIEPGVGARESSGWLPPWEIEDGRLALCVREEAWRFHLLSGSGERLWVSHTVKAHRKPPAVFDVAPPSTYRGRLIDEDGRPVAGAELGINVPFRHDTYLGRATTDRNGAFELTASVCSRHPVLDLRGAVLVDLPAARGEIVDVGEVQLRGESVRRVEVQVVGADGEVSYRLIPRWWRGISATFRLSGPVTPIPSEPVGEDGRISLMLVANTTAALAVECAGEVRWIVKSHELREHAGGVVVVDLARPHLASVRGRVATSMLPCNGVIIEAQSGITFQLTIDPVTGVFRHEGLAPGNWQVVVNDDDGRIHWGDEILQCRPGEDHDFGLVHSAFAGLRVVFPSDAQPDDLVGSCMRVTSGTETLAKHLVTAGDAERGSVDLEVRPGFLSVGMKTRDFMLRGAAMTYAGTTRSCWLSEDTVPLIITGWHQEGIPRPGARLELYDVSGLRILTIPVDEQARRGERKVIVAVPRSPEVEIVFVNGETTRRVTLKIPEGARHARVGVGPMALPEQTFEEPTVTRQGAPRQRGETSLHGTIVGSGQ